MRTAVSTKPKISISALARLIPVGRLGGIDAAVDLLCEHFRRGTRIVVVGDFDADGATSTALVVRQLRRLGFKQVDFLVPNRFQYGYGLTPEIVQLAAESKPGLIVTVDNGISSHAGVAMATSLGIETLITDHHLAPATVPAANAIVNPNAPGDTFPSKALAGVGRRVLFDGGADPSHAGARALSRIRPRSPNCSIWSRSARLRIWCRSIETIACWCHQGCVASAPADVLRAFMRCSKRRIAFPPRWSRRLWAIRSARA